MTRTMPLRVLVVGQTPPPFGGQAVAIHSFVEGSYDAVQLTHVRMAFSRDMSQIGKPRAGKALHLAGLIVRILLARFRSGARILYYPPAGPELLPIVRDIVILLSTRWAFERSIFHFHSAGLSQTLSRLPAPVRALARLAYGRPDLALTPSSLNPPDGPFLGALRTLEVPYGIADPTLGTPARSHRSAHIDRAETQLLYVGVVRETKGVLVLVEACRLLAERGHEIRLLLVGECESDEFEVRLRQSVAEAHLEDRVTMPGRLTGVEKGACFTDSDIFCYPSYFESETFGIVCAEAMAAGLPVVATRWRGIPDVVRDGETGLVVPPQDPAAFADAVEELIVDPERARSFGVRGRQRYLDEFSEERFRRRMEESVLSLAEALP